MKFIETQEVRDRFTGALFGYEDHYLLDIKSDIKGEFEDNRVGERVIKRRFAPFEVHECLKRSLRGYYDER